AQHLHAHFGTNPAAVALLTRTLGGPAYSFTVHGSEEFDSPVSLSLGEKIAHAAFVVGVSDFGRSQLLRWCAHRDWPRVQRVRGGVDAASLRAGPQPVPDTPRLVCVGRLVEQKGQLLLLEALARLAARQVPFAMTLAGDGPLRPLLEEEINRLGLGTRGRIPGGRRNDGGRQEIPADPAL